MLSFAYLPTKNRPTGISDHSSILIDNIFVKSMYLQFESIIIYNDISDHFPIGIHSTSGIDGINQVLKKVPAFWILFLS